MSSTTLRTGRPGQLPNPLARHLLTRVGGGTDLQPAGKRSPIRCAARVFATSVRGIAEHEVVHAYCCQAFGSCGPEWYKEGMAQMSCYRVPGDRAVHCPHGRDPFLARAAASRTGQSDGHCGVFHPDRRVAGQCVQRQAARPGGRPSLKRPHWRAADEAALDKAKESYHRSWALCHLLCGHPAYRDRFQAFGRGLLTDKQAEFGKTFGSGSSSGSCSSTISLSPIAIRATALISAGGTGTMRSSQSVSSGDVGAGQGVRGAIRPPAHCWSRAVAMRSRRPASGRPRGMTLRRPLTVTAAARVDWSGSSTTSPG